MEVGTTSIARGGMGGGERGMLVQWRANHARRRGDGSGVASTCQSPHESLEAVVVITLLKSVEIAK